MSRQVTIMDFVSKYISEQQRRGNEPSIQLLAGLIRKFMKIDDIMILVIQGDSGSGKTTLALRLAATVYGRYIWKNRKRYFVYNWKKAFSRLVWNEKEFFKHVTRLLIYDKKDYLLILDDAGTWLFKGPRNRVVTSFLKMYNLTRGVYASLIFTDIYSLDKYILDTASIRIITEKLSKTEIEELGLDPETRWSRAKVYYKKLTIKGRYEKHWGDIIFPLKTHDEYYEDYKKRRRKRKAELLVNTLKEFRKAEVLSDQDIYEICSSIQNGSEIDEDIYMLILNGVCNG